MNKCDSCCKEVSLTWITYSESVKRKRNWEKEFLAKKGVIKNDNFKLCSPCQTEIKEFKATEVVKELKQNNLADTECFPKNYLKTSNFTAEGAQKVQRAITENVKQHSQEWKIIRTKLLNSDRKYYHDWSGDIRNKELEILIHQTAKIEYGEDLFLKREENKMFLEEYFPSEQWAEIKKEIKSKTQSNNQSLDQQGQKITKFLIIVGITVLIGGTIFFIYLIRKKVGNKKKT